MNTTRIASLRGVVNKNMAKQSSGLLRLSLVMTQSDDKDSPASRSLVSRVK